MGRKILVVDDESLARSTLASIIRKNISFDCEVFEASSGYEAIEIFEKHKPQVIFIDINMTGLSGIDAAEQILKSDPDCYIYIITAYDYFHYIQRALEIGVKGYVLKPPSADDVIRKINKAYFIPDTGTIAERASEKAEFQSSYKYKYPSENEQLFLEKIKFMQLDEAYNVGRLTLEYFFSMRDNIPLMKEFLCEFFVILNRHLIEMRIDIDRSYNISFYESCLKTNDFEQLKKLSRDELDKYFTLLSQNENKKNSLYIQSALKIVEKDTNNNITLERISKELALTPQYFSRLFKEQTGVNFIDFVTEKRVNKAKHLLETTQESVRDISRITGYDDVNYFSRVFKKITGLTPTEYRLKSNAT